jgi:hypothetical protein
MTEYPAGRSQRPSDLTPRLRLAALTAVIIGVLLLAAAAFLLSYSGIHHIALQAGVSPKLARLYPGIFDAMLVIACAAVLALRGAGWVTRLYVWLCLIVLLAAVATGDAVHAMGIAIPRQPSRAGVAITPWALVLLSFGLLLAMLRYLRRTRSTGRGQTEQPAEQPAGQASALEAADAAAAPRAGLDSLLEPRPGEPPALHTAEQPPPAGAPDASAPGDHATPGQPRGYAADAYAGAETPDATEEYYGHEGYGMEDYAEEYPAPGPAPDGTQPAGTAPDGTQPDGADQAGAAAGPRAGAQDGQPANGDSPPAPAACAPAGPLDRMRSSPTRPED